jgi:membrane protease subunit HflK
MENLWTVGSICVLVGVVFIALCLFTSFYTVDADETAVVLRFGKIVDETQPGLHFKLPFFIERVKKVAVRKVFKEEYGFRTTQAGIRTEYSEEDLTNESLLLTGDLNNADVEWVTQYKIKDPKKYLFFIRNPIDALRDLSESVMSRIIGDRTVTEVLTIGRIDIATEVKSELQILLDLYQSGLHITTITLQDVNPPDAVKASFNEVNEAKQKKDQLINEAWRSYNKEIPKAKGLAQQMISESEGYAIDRINRAKGDAKRFDSILTQYKKSKDVTRSRIYLETMREVLDGVELWIIDENNNAPIPILQLHK